MLLPFTSAFFPFVYDEYAHPQKRTGCMTGIFQLFDRYQMGVSVKRFSDRSHQSTLQCHSQSTDGRAEEEFIASHQRQPADMNLYRNASDRQRFSTESSRASVSSSRSSSFSSVDYYRGTHPDPAHNDRITFSEAAFENSHRVISPRIAWKSADLRDVVRDSMLKEARGLSLKTTGREVSMNCGLKQRDDLRDLKLFKTVDGGARTKGNQHVRDNLNESADVPSKIRGAEWGYNEPKEQRRMSDYWHRFKDPSRLSYDGMETSRLSIDSREALSASKLRDLPRLSLDGREFLVRQVHCDSSLNFQSPTFLKKSYSTKEMSQPMMEESTTQKQRSPSVIAKLMGLTALPDSSTLATQNDGSFNRTRNAKDGLEAIDTGKPIVDSKAPSSKKQSASPRWITFEMKPTSSSRIPVEQAPWKNLEKGATLLRHPSRRIKSPTRQSIPMPSVYSEMEKRLKDIEFNQSGKDLRALKQILDSIHAKQLLEDEKREQILEVQTTGKQESTLIKVKPRNASMKQENARGEHLTEAVAKHDTSLKPLDTQLQILITKPLSRSPRSQTSKNMYNDNDIEKCESTQHSSRPQQQPKDNSASSPRKLGSISPRIRLKKLESEKQKQSPGLSSDPSKHRVQVSKLPMESSSPGRKVLPRITNKKQNGIQVPEIQLEVKKMRYQRNEVPLPAERNVGLYCKRDKEVSHTMGSNQVNGSHSPSRKSSKELIVACDKSSYSKHSSLPVKHEEAAAPEHPSPVSVLNMAAYMDDSSTEEKQISTPPEDLAEGYGTFKSNFSGELFIASEISRKKLLSIDSLVQKLKRLNSTHDESRTDYIALLCDNTNPDHRYISEILLASGLLLREFGSDAINFQLHPSGFLINPELFNVLEQTKSSANTSINANADESKSHRKLIFDTVNEMLTKKLTSNENLTDYTVKRVPKTAISTQNLVKELCAEMEQLKPKEKKNQENKMVSEDESAAVKDLLWKDVTCSRLSDNWNVYEGGTSEVVLEIERSLFKNLVNEIVISDYRSARPKSGNRHNRFMK